jgi:hypothetical protein
LQTGSPSQFDHELPKTVGIGCDEGYKRANLLNFAGYDDDNRGTMGRWDRTWEKWFTAVICGDPVVTRL